MVWKVLLAGMALSSLFGSLFVTGALSHNIRDRGPHWQKALALLALTTAGFITQGSYANLHGDTSGERFACLLAVTLGAGLFGTLILISIWKEHNPGEVSALSVPAILALYALAFLAGRAVWQDLEVSRLLSLSWLACCIVVAWVAVAMLTASIPDTPAVRTDEGVVRRSV